MFIKSKGTHIPEHKGHKELSTSAPVFEYLAPEYVYIPLVEANTPCEALVKVGDKVKVGQVVATKKGRFPINLHASVSGEVVSVNQKMWHCSGRLVPTIQIKNDFQETKIETKHNDVGSLTREEIIAIVKDAGIVGLGGASFPAYAKYETDCQIDYVILNAAECEPYLTADYTLLTHHLDAVLRGLKYIMRAADCNRGVIAIKANKKALIEKIKLAIAEEESLSLFLLKDVYPAGWEKYIVQRVTNRDYKGLPSEARAVVNNVGTAHAIARAVEENQPLVDKILTVTGEGIRHPQNVHVKIGTNMREVVQAIGGYASDLGEAYFVAGGPMTGKAVAFDTLIVNRALTSVVVMPKDIREINPECMGCGKCGEVCPVFLSPIVIKEALQDNEISSIAELRPELCMECGLCSYICPSRIELTDSVVRAKNKVLAAR